MRKPVSTKTHGFLDYAMAGTLILLPWLLSRASRKGAPTALATLAGAGIISQSLFTDYEWGVRPVWSMRTHLRLDYIGALLLGASPWLLGFSRQTKWPFVTLALIELSAVVLSDDQPGRVTTPKPLEHAFTSGKDLFAKVTQQARPLTDQATRRAREVAGMN